MRKLFLSISFLLISFLNYSQNSNIKFGVQVGVNYSNFYGYEIPTSPSYSESPEFAFLGGVNFEYQIREKLSLKLELNYERKSQKAENIIENQEPDVFPSFYNYTSKKNSDYLVLPIMVKYSFADHNSFYVNGGPFVGYLLKSNLEQDLYANGSGKESQTIVTTDSNKRTDFGLSIGIGKNFKLSEKSSIFIEIRENLGLAKTNKYDVWDGGNVKTNSLNLIIGYSMN